MKKIIILILIVLFTSGCSDYRELSDMAMISNIAIDKEDDKYKVIVQVLDSSNSSSSSGESSVSPSVTVYESVGKTLHEAFRNVTLEYLMQFLYLKIHFLMELRQVEEVHSSRH